MRITTHGKHRGRIELVAAELRVLQKAVDLLSDLESFGGLAVTDQARVARDSLALVVETLTHEEPVSA